MIWETIAEFELRSRINLAPSPCGGFRPGAELAGANSKFFEKVLDKMDRLWYTIGVKGRGQTGDRVAER